MGRGGRAGGVDEGVVQSLPQLSGEGGEALPLPEDWLVAPHPVIEVPLACQVSGVSRTFLAPGDRGPTAVTDHT